MQTIQKSFQEKCLSSGVCWKQRAHLYYPAILLQYVQVPNLQNCRLKGFYINEQMRHVLVDISVGG